MNLFKGKKSHDIVSKGLEALANLGHRGAAGADPETGDGAGILIQMPDKFFRSEAENWNVDLPFVGKYGVGMTFMPIEEQISNTCEKNNLPAQIHLNMFSNMANFKKQFQPNPKANIYFI